MRFYVLGLPNILIKLLYQLLSQWFLEIRSIQPRTPYKTFTHFTRTIQYKHSEKWHWWLYTCDTESCTHVATSRGTRLRATLYPSHSECVSHTHERSLLSTNVSEPTSLTRSSRDTLHEHWSWRHLPCYVADRLGYPVTQRPTHQAPWGVPGDMRGWIWKEGKTKLFLVSSWRG